MSTKTSRRGLLFFANPSRFLHRPRRLVRRFMHVGARDARTDHSLAMPFAEPPVPADVRIAVVIHMFNVDMTERFCALAIDAEIPVDLLVTTDTPEKMAMIEYKLRGIACGKVVVRLVPNRGRDVLPKLYSFSDYYNDYELLLFLHSKKSAHIEEGDDWASFLFANLLGSPAHVHSIISIFAKNPDVGLIFPQHFERIRQYLIWNNNFPVARRLARRMGLRLRARAPLDFVSGSMFWARPNALRPLIQLGLTAQDFPDELGQTEGTVAHAIERLYLHSTELAGYKWLKIADPGLYRNQDTIVEIAGSDEVPAFLERHGLCLLGSNFQVKKDRRS